MRYQNNPGDLWPEHLLLQDGLLDEGGGGGGRGIAIPLTQGQGPLPAITSKKYSSLVKMMLKKLHYRKAVKLIGSMPSIMSQMRRELLPTLKLLSLMPSQVLKALRSVVTEDFSNANIVNAQL